MKPRAGHHPLLFAVLVIVLLSLLASCAMNPGRRADHGVARWARDLSSNERAELEAALPAEALREFLPLSEIFYARITSRRFNSRATFEDPSVRQFFPTVAAYSDYYAALVDELDRAHIRFNRPSRVDLLGIEISESGTLSLALRIIGRNDLPLRFWNATLLRTDEWVWREGRWFIVPGKV